MAVSYLTHNFPSLFGLGTACLEEIEDSKHEQTELNYTYKRVCIFIYIYIYSINQCIFVRIFG